MPREKAVPSARAAASLIRVTLLNLHRKLNVPLPLRPEHDTGALRVSVLPHQEQASYIGFFRTDQPVWASSMKRVAVCPFDSFAWGSSSAHTRIARLNKSSTRGEMCPRGCQGMETARPYSRAAKCGTER